MLLKTLRDIYFVYNRNLSTDTTFSKYNWTEILYQHLPIIGHIFIKNKQTNTYYIYTCLLLVMYSLKPKQTNKQTNKHILYLPLLITGHVFIKTKTSKQTNKQTNTYYIYTCLLLVMYSLKPKQAKI